MVSNSFIDMTGKITYIIKNIFQNSKVSREKIIKNKKIYMTNSIKNKFIYIKK